MFLAMAMAICLTMPIWAVAGTSSATCTSQCGGCSGDTCRVAGDGTVTCTSTSSCGDHCQVTTVTVITCGDEDFGPKGHVQQKLPG